MVKSQVLLDQQEAFWATMTRAHLEDLTGLKKVMASSDVLWSIKEVDSINLIRFNVLRNRIYWQRVDLKCQRCVRTHINWEQDFLCHFVSLAFVIEGKLILRYSQRGDSKCQRFVRTHINWEQDFLCHFVSSAFVTLAFEGKVILRYELLWM